MERVSHSWMDCLVADRVQERSRAGRWSGSVIAGWTVLLPSCSSTLAFLDTVFVTLFSAAVEIAVSGVHKLLGSDGVPTSLTLLFWWWLTVSLIFTGRSERTRNNEEQ